MLAAVYHGNVPAITGDMLGMYIAHDLGGVHFAADCLADVDGTLAAVDRRHDVMVYLARESRWVAQETLSGSKVLLGGSKVSLSGSKASLPDLATTSEVL